MTISHNQLLAFLNELHLFSSQAIELEQVLDLILDRLVNKLNLNSGILFLLNDRTGRYEITCSRGVSAFRRQELEEIFQYRTNQDWPQIAAQKRETVHFCGSSEEQQLDVLLNDHKDSASVYIPLSVSGATVGVLALVTNPFQILDRSDLATLTMIGEQVGLVIQNFQITADLVRKEREALTLYQMGTQFGDSLDEIRILRTLAESVRFSLAADVGLIAILDEEYKELVVRFTSNPQDDPLNNLHIQLTHPAAFEQLASGKAILVDSFTDLKTLPHTVEWVTKYGYTCYLAIPLIYQGFPIGLLGVLTRQPRRFSKTEITQITRLGNMVVYPIGSARLFKRGQSLGVLEERTRLAREMHDQLAQRLSYLNLKLNAVSELLLHKQLDLVDLGLQDAKAIVRDAYDDVREIIYNLRSPMISGADWIPQLKRYLEDYQLHYGLDILLHVPDSFAVFLSEDVIIQTTRILQEAITNVRKHAQRDAVSIRMENQGNFLAIEIEDFGKGFTLSEFSGKRAGVGLQVMQERAQSIRGELKIISQPGEGTKINLRVPIQ